MPKGVGEKLALLSPEEDGRSKTKKPQTPEIEKRNPPSETGKAQQKAKKRQLELKACVQKARLDLSLFTLLSLHKLDHPVMDSTPVITREALLIIFVHHLVDRAHRFNKVISVQQSAQAPQPVSVPLIPDQPLPASDDLIHSAAAGTLKAPITKLGSHHSSEDETATKAATDSNHQKRILKWARSAAKEYSCVRLPHMPFLSDEMNVHQALKLQDSPSALKLVRSVDQYILKLRENEMGGTPLHPSSPREPRKTLRRWNVVRNGRSPTGEGLNPLVFNPQPPKRHLVTVGHFLQVKVLRAIEELSTTHAVLHSKSMQAAPAPQGGRFPTALGSLIRPQKKTLESEQQTGMEWSFLEASIGQDQIVQLTDEEQISLYLQSREFLFLPDLAERIGHLPAFLTQRLLNARAFKAVAPSRAIAIAPLPSSYKTPTKPEPSEDRKDQHERHSSKHNHAQILALPNASFDSNLVAWTSGASESEEEGSSKLHSSSSSEDSIRWNSAPAVERAEPASFTDSSVADEPSFTRTEMAAEILSIFPIHVIIFWESLYGMLQLGMWDAAIEDCLRELAQSLDVCADVFELLVSYTADVIAEKLNNANVPIAGPPPPDTGDFPPVEVTEPDRSLATANTQTLRVQTNRFSRARVLKITGMALGVGALSALTAGLAAPAFAAGIGALGIAGTSGFATFLGTMGGSAALASLFGASSASLSGWKFSRRLADIRVFEFVHLESNYIIHAVAIFMSEVMENTLVLSPITKSRIASAQRPKPSSSRKKKAAPTSLVVKDINIDIRKEQPPFRLIIGISGWLNTIDDATRPWEFLGESLGSELFAIKWEPHLLTALGLMMVRMVGEQFAASAASLWIQMTMTAGTGIILWPVSLLQYAGQLDNTWMTCRERAQQAGYLLAAALGDRALVGHRPVILIGYSMGSRIISYALRELYNRGHFDRVQHAVLMGLPGSKTRENWRRMRSVVSGRLINVYCTTDWILGFLYRWMEWGLQVAGLSAVEGVEGVENFDATGIIL